MMQVWDVHSQVAVSSINTDSVGDKGTTFEPRKHIIYSNQYNYIITDILFYIFDKILQFFL